MPVVTPKAVNHDKMGNCTVDSTGDVLEHHPASPQHLKEQAPGEESEGARGGALLQGCAVCHMILSLSEHFVHSRCYLHAWHVSHISWYPVYLFHL